MRILHVVPSYLPARRYGGVVRSVHGLCRALVQLGHEVDVFTTPVDGPRDSDVPTDRPVERDGVRVHYFPCPRLRRLYWSPAMGRALRDGAQGYDLIHTHSVFLWPTMAAARAAARAGVPFVVAPRGMLVRELIERRSPWLKKTWIALVERGNLQRASAVHVTSEAEADALRALALPLPEVVVVANGVNPPRDAESPADDGELDRLLGAGPFLLFLGRISWKKGLDRLIPALARLPGRRLVVAGNDEEGYRAELEVLARRCGVSDRVLFLGPRYGAQKWALYRRATAFVLPSYSENFGNTVLEAMACGCPVVVTPEVGLAATLSEHGAGLVADGSAESLAGGLDRLLHDTVLRSRQTARARALVTERFLWNRIGEEMVAVYRHVIERHEHGSQRSPVYSRG